MRRPRQGCQLDLLDVADVRSETQAPASTLDAEGSRWMGRKGEPNRLHLVDCWHPAEDTPYRPATAQELRQLPTYFNCVRRADTT